MQAIEIPGEWHADPLVELVQASIEAVHIELGGASDRRDLSRVGPLRNDRQRPDGRSIPVIGRIEDPTRADPLARSASAGLGPVVEEPAAVPPQRVVAGRELTYWGSKPEPPKIPSADQRGLSRARSMG